MKNKHIVLDVETGGLDPYKNPITQIAWQVIDNETLALLESGDFFIKPYNDFVIEPEAIAASQTSMVQINAGLDFRQAGKRLIEAFNGATSKGGKIRYLPVIVGHNIGFDMGFLEVLFALLNKDLYDYVDKVAFCTMKEMMRFEGFIKNKKEKLAYNLTACCERLGIKLKNAHGAANDVAATVLLFLGQIKLLRKGDVANITQGRTERKSVRTFFEM